MSTPINVAAMSMQQRLKIVIEDAADQLGPDLGKQLLDMVSPGSLATAAAVMTVWAGSQLFIAGELADVGLLIVGYLAEGEAAWQAGKALGRCAALTLTATTPENLRDAESVLTEAITTLGLEKVQDLIFKEPENLLQTRSAHRDFKLSGI